VKQHALNKQTTATSKFENVETCHAVTNDVKTLLNDAGPSFKSKFSECKK